MATPIGSIIRAATRRPDEKYNVLSYVTHERYSSCMAGCNADFHLLCNGPGVKGEWIKQYADVPKNHILLPKFNQNPLEVIPSWTDVDFCMGQHRFGQAQHALQLAQYFSCPSLVLEHTTVTNKQLEDAREQLKQVRGDINVFISKSSAEAWGWDLNDPSVEIIHHGVDTNLFKQAFAIDEQIQPHILCVVNDWRNRGDILGFDIFERVCGNNKLPVRVLGDNPGISQPPPNIYSLVKAYQECSIFYNTSRHSPIPTVILEAMACGKPVVTTDNYLISDIIINGYNGYKTNSEAEQLKHLRRLLKDPAECRELGLNARKTILDHFNLPTFVERWNNVFDKLSKIRK